MSHCKRGKSSYTWGVDLYEEPIAAYVTESSDILVEMLEEEYNFELLEQYREKYIDVELCDCSGQFAEWLLRTMKEENGNGRR